LLYIERISFIFISSLLLSSSAARQSVFCCVMICLIQGFEDASSSWTESSACCLLYLFSLKETNLIKKLSWDINTEMIMMSIFVTFELLLSHDETVEIARSTVLTEKRNENIIKLNFLWFLDNWNFENIVVDDDLIIYSCLNRH
jgi:hypothetical protein